LPPNATASVAIGSQLVNRYLCLGCHRINGDGGEEGPDLSIVGSHRNWLWLYAHLAKPKAIVPVSTMPVFNLTRDEIRDITIYLMTLLESRDQLWNSSLRAKRVAETYEPHQAKKRERERPISDEAPAVEQFQYDGKALFRGAGCSLCHMIGNRGGEVGPALTYIGRKRKAEELERLLKDPEQLLPGGKMPQLYLNEQQIKALVAYLSALQ
jgi:cytochrome c2